MYKTFESIQTNGTAKVIAAAAIQTFFVKLSRVIFFEKGHFYSKRLSVFCVCYCGGEW
jgi:hypothetical protein